MRTYDDYSTFTAGESMWFAADRDARVLCNGIMWVDGIRTDILTCNGSIRPGTEPAPRGHPTRPPRALKIPMMFLPPRRN